MLTYADEFYTGASSTSLSAASSPGCSHDDATNIDPALPLPFLPVRLPSGGLSEDESEVISLLALLVQKVQILTPEELRLQLQVLSLLALLAQKYKS